MREVVSSNPDGLSKCLYLVIEKNLPRVLLHLTGSNQGRGEFH